MQKKSFFVLMFHGIVSEKPEHFLYGPSANCFVREADFEKVVRFCSKNYKLLRLADLDSYYDGTATEDGILISFDDGLQSFIKLGVPVLQKYGATATVFLTSDWTNSGLQPAIFSLEYQLYHCLPTVVAVNMNDTVVEKKVHTKKDIPIAIDWVWEQLFEKKIAPLSLTDDDILLNGTPLSLLKPEKDGGYWKPASWEVLKDAQKGGIIEIGAHGQTHTPFNWLTETQLVNELEENKRQITHKLQIPVTACSFPHGLYDDKTSDIMERYFRYGFANNIVTGGANKERLVISRYNVPFQRPNNIGSLINYPFMGKVLRKFGSITGFY